MGEVVELNAPTTLDIPSEKILQGAIDAKVQDAIVIGWDAKENFYFPSATGDVGDIILMLEVAKRQLLDEIGG